MQNTALDPPLDLTAFLRRCIVIGGLALGGWGVAHSIILIADGSLNLTMHSWFLTHIHRTSVVIWLMSELVLVVGAGAFHFRRSWARLLLLLYSGMFVGAMLGLMGSYFMDTLASFRGRLHEFAILMFASGLVGEIVSASVFPAFLLLFLNRPEFKPTLAQPPGGFVPIVTEHS
jgi:hypothetical protein